MNPVESAGEIVICLGSSCFARGNGDHLATIKEHLDKYGLAETVHLSGLLCQNQCKSGPNLTINGESLHEVTSDRLVDLLKRLNLQQRHRDG